MGELQCDAFIAKESAPPPRRRVAIQDLNDKVTGPGPTGQLTAAEWNEVPSELQNVIEAFLALSGADLNQLGKAIANYAGTSPFYSETGVADAYVATVIGSKQGPTSYIDGLTVRIRPGNANTGASTINVNGLGVKSILREDGGALAPGDLDTNRDAVLRYDLANDRFNLALYSLIQTAPTGFAPRGHHAGFFLTNDGGDPDHDLNISQGQARDSQDVETLVRASTLRKEIDNAWVEGNGGGFPTGITLSASTWYNVFIIRKDDGTVDGGFDTSSTAANLLSDAGASYSTSPSFRRVGSVLTDGSSNIIGFQQHGDLFVWDEPRQDISVNPPDTLVQTHTLASIPTGIKCEPIFSLHLFDGSGAIISLAVGSGLLSTLPAVGAANRDLTVNGTTSIPGESIFPRGLVSSTSQQILTRVDARTASTIIAIMVHGWADQRGRFA